MSLWGGGYFSGAPSLTDPSRNRSANTPDMNQWALQRRSMINQNPYTGNPYAGIYGGAQTYQPASSVYGSGSFASEPSSYGQSSVLGSGLGGILGKISQYGRQTYSPFMSRGYGYNSYSPFGFGGLGSMFGGGGYSPFGGYGGLGGLGGLLGFLMGGYGRRRFGGYGGTPSYMPQTGVFTGSGWNGTGSSAGASTPWGPAYY